MVWKAINQTLKKDKKNVSSLPTSIKVNDKALSKPAEI